MTKTRFSVGALLLTGLLAALPGCGGSILKTSSSSTGFNGDVSDPFKLNGQSIDLPVGSAASAVKSTTFDNGSVPSNLNLSGGTVSFTLNQIKLANAGGAALPTAFRITSLTATKLSISDTDANNAPRSIALSDLTLAAPVTVTQTTPGNYAPSADLTVSGTLPAAQIQSLLAVLKDGSSNTFTYTLTATTAPATGSSADVPAGSTLTLTVTGSNLHAILTGS